MSDKLSLKQNCAELACRVGAIVCVCVRVVINNSFEIYKICIIPNRFLGNHHSISNQLYCLIFTQFHHSLLLL